MSSKPDSSFASDDGSSLTQPGTVNPISEDSGSNLTGTEPFVSFARRLYDAWKAGLGPTYGIDTKRGDGFMKLFDAQPLKIQGLHKDAEAGEGEDDRKERKRQRDRLRSAYLKTYRGSTASWTTGEHKEFADLVARSS